MWFSLQTQQVRISIFAKPNSRQTGIIGVDDRWLTVAVRARPEEGKANAELVAWLSTLLGVPKSRIILLKGETSRYKQLALPLTHRVEVFLKDPLALLPHR